MDNRENILTCALNLFSSRGYDGVSVQEIVESAGITKPTLYYYFGSKEGLLESIIEANFNRLYDITREAALYNGDLPLTLYRVVKAHFIFAKEHSIFYRMQLSMWFAPPESDSWKIIARFNKRHFNIIEEMFIAASQNHGNMKGRHKALGATFLGMINTYIGLALNGYTELNDELIYRAVQQFMYGIFS
jgi:TetR/AcrR family transcriptional regulator